MALRHGDLKDSIYNIFEIDAYKSKMGKDRDIVTVSFSVRDSVTAEDLENFIEKGYPFVLDADKTSGEQEDGTYKVFVEIERGDEIASNLLELTDGVSKLGAIDNLRFKYYKSFDSYEVTNDTLSEMIPVNPTDYEVKVNESNMNNYKNFFNRSYVESISMLDDTLTISKKWADPLRFKFVEFGEREHILNNLQESLNVNDFAEVIFLCKYVGDYNITKYGKKLTFENAGYTLVLERLVS